MGNFDLTGCETPELISVLLGIYNHVAGVITCVQIEVATQHVLV